MNVPTTTRGFKELPIGLIDGPALPSRSSMDEQKMDELVASIRDVGLQQPIIVARVGERFEVIAGHRRRLACGRAGLLTAPCFIYPSKTDFDVAVQFAENRHREDLNPADEAIWFSELLEGTCAGDVDVLCARLGEKRGYVESRLLLFSGDERVFEKMRAGEIKLGVAQELNKCTAERYRRYLLHQAIVGGATVAVVKGWVMDWQRDERARSGEPEHPVSAPAPSPAPELNYFTCAICGGTHDVHRMQPVNIHGDCKTAIFDKLVAAYRGE
jgi:ParB family chromosome partitioning protein